MNEKSQYQLKNLENLLKYAGLPIIIFVLLTINCFGQTITWEKTHLYSPFIRGQSVKQTTDGNYIICGSRESYGFIAKLNQYGDTVWVRNYPVLEMNYIIESNDGNYVAVGYALDMFVVKVAPNGNTIWSRLLTEPGYDVHPINLNITNDGNFISTGYLEVNNPTFLSAYYVKFDNNGNKLWSKFIGPQTGNKTLAHVKQLTNNGFILTGSIRSGNNPQIYLVRTVPNGDTLWTKEYGNPNQFVVGNVVFQTNSSGFFVIGNINYTNSNVKLYLVSTDSVGNLLWSKIYGDTNSFHEILDGDCVIKNNSQNSYIITGLNVNFPLFDTAKVFLLNIDSVGNKIWEKKFKKDTLDIFGWAIDNCSDSGYIVTGIAYSYSSFAKSDPPSLLYALKTNKFGEINPIGININTSNIPREFKLLQNYPNPFNPLTRIQFEIPITSDITIKFYNILGMELETFVNMSYLPGIYTYDLNGENYPSGIYFVTLSNGKDYYMSIKIALIK